MGHSDGLFPWPAITRAFSALLVRTPARWARGPCSVAMTDLHSLQTMSAASFAFITSNIIDCFLLQVGHQTRENRASASMFLAPVLFRFPLHRRSRRVLHLQPIGRAPGAIA